MTKFGFASTAEMAEFRRTFSAELMQANKVKQLLMFIYVDAVVRSKYPNLEVITFEILIVRYLKEIVKLHPLLITCIHEPFHFNFSILGLFQQIPLSASKGKFLGLLYY